MLTDSHKFDGKLVLITGSTSGIGEATAGLFASVGARVVITGRNESSAGRVAQHCEQISPKRLKPLIVLADLSKEEDIDRLVDTVIDKYGQLDVLVNNAGIGGGSVSESLHEFDLKIKVNLRSVYQLCMRTLPLLEMSKGVIVNNSSICGLKPPSVCYCVAKAGLDMLTRSLAVNWGPKGVRVNGVNPGQIDTQIWSSTVNMDPKQLSDMWMAVEERYPLRRRGYPDDVARAILFLASDSSSFITGVNLKIDGGFLDSAQLVWN